MMFHGLLYYKDSSDLLEVELIVREDHLAFQLTTTWGEHGKWSVDGKAYPAGSEYVSEEMPSYQGSRKGPPCIIRFRIYSQTDNELLLKGAWSESGETYEFEGNLKKLPNRLFKRDQLKPAP